MKGKHKQHLQHVSNTQRFCFYKLYKMPRKTLLDAENVEKHDTLFPRFLVLFWLVVRLGRKMWKFREDFWILHVEEEGKRMLLCFIFFFWFWKNPRKSKGGGKYILWDFYISIRWKDFRVFLLRIMPVGKRGFSLKNYGRRIFIGSFHFQWTML